MTEREMAGALEHESGLLGLAGADDLREVLARAEGGDGRAQLALDVHRLRPGIAAMAAALGGLDVLVFTGGVGERAASIRARAVAGLGFLGLAIDESIDARGQDAELTAPRRPSGRWSSGRARTSRSPIRSAAPLG